MKHKDLVGKVCQGRQGLGFGVDKQQRWDAANAKEKEVRQMEDDNRMTKAVGMGTQGAWMKWKDAVSRQITWNELWKMEPARFQFIVRATYDLLPTPTNLLRRS